ncbi:aldehyde dehydrogenase family protein [Lacisediminihabitans profunda]|uniref:Aldehyde dehydrogenase family protein n=1 Tax=Lacisediminihabitans profunda TaxID=2594790 RepID=A0A5C8UM82_9MICO|nr:aldehyde dehydrogenase family protein [Lacisediminihabitans profunda]TXN29462.1 aldehyde dehydrogenase family protein [Lacisediminihabitans profunda]
MTASLKLLVDGQYVDASNGRTFQKLSPVTGDVIADVAAASLVDVENAIRAASDAFDRWSGTPFTERRRVLLTAADYLESRVGEITDEMASETGSTARWAGMNTAEACATLREAAGLTSTSTGELLPSHDPASSNLSVRVPAGVVLAIVPWNAPLVLAARSVAIALAVGNTVVLRPSEESPNAAGHLLADALMHAGIPSGVINVLTSAPGEGREVIRAAIAHPHVRRVVFIGSTLVGRQLAEVAGNHLTPTVMELGGKNPTIVLDDADLDVAADQLVFSSFANSGQVCMATDRIIASGRIYDELVHRLVARSNGLVVGDPRKTITDLGPLINERAASQFRHLVRDAESTGAVRLTGSGDTDGLYATPVMLAGLSKTAQLFYEEAFSPIVSVQRAIDENDAIRQANDTEFGLIASVLSGDAGHAWNVANRIRAGAVHVNGPSVGDEPHVPFGGVGMSGFGRLGGIDSIRTFTEQRTLYLHGVSLAVPILK